MLEIVVTTEKKNYEQNEESNQGIKRLVEYNPVVQKNWLRPSGAAGSTYSKQEAKL